MLQIASTFKGSWLQANDGELGSVTDLLFDDRTWKIRWLVVDTGSWLPGRKVLLHPSAIENSNPDERALRVDLTKDRIRNSPDLAEDQPVSRQAENSLYTYYGCNPMWDTGVIGGGGLGLPGAMPVMSGASSLGSNAPDTGLLDRGDPHLRSIHQVTGYHVHATDGVIGHIENFLLDDQVWGVRYLIIDTGNWWPGRDVLLSPYAITTIDWLERDVRLDVSRAKVRASPAWKRPDRVDQVYERHLHEHYGWPGYGW